MSPAAVSGAFVKRVLLVFGVLLVPWVAQAETPEVLLGLVPPFPAGACGMEGEAEDAYVAKMDELLDRIDAELQRRQDASEVLTQGLDAKEETGGDPSGVEDGTAVAEKALSEKFGLSMKDIEKLGQMSEQGQKAQMQAYATAQMAGAQAAPKESREDQAKAKLMVESAREVERLTRATSAPALKAHDRIDQLTRKASDDPARREIAALERERNEAPDSRREGLNGRIRAIQRGYCTKYTTEYQSILGEYLPSIRASLPDLVKLDRARGKLEMAQTGLDRPLTEPGFSGIKWIRDYASLQRDAFRFVRANGSN